MKFILILASLILSQTANAKLNVLTTLTDLRAITAEIGGEFVQAESLAKGTQDPHFIETKPSYMLKAHNADLVISMGMELEIGYLPSIIQGARNPKINVGSPGYLELGPLVQALEVPSGNVSRAEGDIHPYGNPHISLDPIRMGEIALGIGARLAELDPAHAATFNAKALALKTRLENKTKLWQERITKSGVKKVVSYHKTLTYFFDRFHLLNAAILEPKPGIPPTSGHILEVIEIIKAQKVPLILVENYFDPTVTNKIKNSVPSVRAATVAVSVEGSPEIKTIDDLYEGLVKAIEGK